MVQIPQTARIGPDSKAHQKQLEILRAASRAFRLHGLHATGMREIAAESGMHVGNLYYYFRNKQELLAFCQDQTLRGLIELAHTVQRQASSPDEQLFRLIVGHVVHLNDEMPGSLAHLEVEALDEPWRQEIVARRDRYENLMREIIDEGIHAGAFRPLATSVAVKAILGAANWTVKWYLPTGDRTSRDIGREFATLLVRGLLAPGYRSAVPELEA